MARIDSQYVAVPLSSYYKDNSDIMDFEDEQIQVLRDKKMQEEIEHKTKIRIQQIIDK